MMDWISENKNLETMGNILARTNTQDITIVRLLRNAFYYSRQIFAASTVGFLGQRFKR